MKSSASSLGNCRGSARRSVYNNSSKSLRKNAGNHFSLRAATSDWSWSISQNVSQLDPVAARCLFGDGANITFTRVSSMSGEGAVVSALGGKTNESKPPSLTTDSDTNQQPHGASSVESDAASWKEKRPLPILFGVERRRCILKKLLSPGKCGYLAIDPCRVGVVWAKPERDGVVHSFVFGGHLTCQQWRADRTLQ